MYLDIILMSIEYLQVCANMKRAISMYLVHPICYFLFSQEKKIEFRNLCIGEHICTKSSA